MGYRTSLSTILCFLVLGSAAQNMPWGQCGGIGWTGGTSCPSGWSCVVSNQNYFQCLQGSPASIPGPSGPPSSTSIPSSTTLTGIAGSAPTVGPSKLTGRTPALGWNTWNAYGCDISEAKILAAAGQFVSLGLQAAGYNYINVDDCWALESRDASTQRIVPDPTKFPNGISGVASQVHALGLKFGIYSDAGTATCAGFPGSLDYESLDASTFNEWGIDYLKYDNCNVPANWTDSPTPPNNDWYNSNSAIRYRQMTAALAALPRPVQFSLCIWGTANVWDWGAKVGHSWRMSGDSTATWSYIMSIISTNVQHLSVIDFFAHNDMDMMEIGNGQLTIEEQRTHFAVWCFFKSPILLGTDLSNLSADQLAIVKNRELLAFHQDVTIGKPAVPFTSSSEAPTTNPPEYYAGLSSKGIHVFIINTSENSTTKSFDFSNVPGIPGRGQGRYIIHDMWTGKDLGVFSANYSTTVAAHDTVAFRLTHRS